MRNVSFCTKVYGLVGLIVITALTVAGSGYYLQQRLGAEIEESAQKTAPKIDLVNSLRADAWKLGRLQLTAFVAASLQRQAQLDAAQADWEQGAREAEQHIQSMRQLAVTGAGRVKLNEVTAAFNEYAPIARRSIEMCRQGRFDQAVQMEDELTAKTETLNARVRELRTMAMGLVTTSLNRSTDLRHFGSAVSLILLCVLSGVATVAFVVLYRANAHLGQIVDSLALDASNVASAASQVSGEAHELAAAANEQAASIEEASASTYEIQSISQHNRDSADAASKQTVATAGAIEETAGAMGQVVSAMEEIVDSSAKIQKIIKVIDEIAFQTNILALNAAVEAARAGEAGMGFAVVADEVRSLSHRSAQAAKDTADLIGASMQSSAAGRQRLDLLAGKIESLVTGVQEVKQLSEEVRQGSTEQSRGVEQISNAMGQLEQITQKIAANAEEGASAGEELAAQANAVGNSVGALAQMLGRKLAVGV